MRKIILVAALATLAACNDREAAPAAEAETEATTEVATAPAEVMAADGKSPVGMYKITTADGKVIMDELKADGTYSDTIDGKVVETGRWVQKTPETFCYTKDGEGAKEVCNTEKVDAAGVWTSTNPEGKTATVERVQA